MTAINWVRIQQQVLFLSDVLAANGKMVKEKYRHLCRPLDQWSTYRWPHVYPTILWQQDLDHITPNNHLNDCLGGWSLTKYENGITTQKPIVCTDKQTLGGINMILLTYSTQRTGLTKHTIGTARTMKYLSHQIGESPLCPSCNTEQETTQHITQCLDRGQQKALTQSINLLDHWMSKPHTDPVLREVVVGYSNGQVELPWQELFLGFPLGTENWGLTRTG